MLMALPRSIQPCQSERESLTVCLPKHTEGARSASPLMSPLHHGRREGCLSTGWCARLNIQESPPTRELTPAQILVCAPGDSTLQSHASFKLWGGSGAHTSATANGQNGCSWCYHFTLNINVAMGQHCTSLLTGCRNKTFPRPPPPTHLTTELRRTEGEKIVLATAHQ